MACRVRQANSAIGFRVGTATAASGDTPHSDLLDADWRAVRHAVLTYVRRRGHSRDVAEDVAQGSLTKPLHYTRQGQAASLYALAFQIAPAASSTGFVAMFDMEPASGATPARNRYQTRSSQPTPLRYDRMVSQFYAVPSK